MLHQSLYSKSHNIPCSLDKGFRSIAEVNCPSSSAPLWLKLSSHTPACSPGTAVQPGCWLDCLGSVHLEETTDTREDSRARMRGGKFRRVCGWKYTCASFNGPSDTYALTCISTTCIIVDTLMTDF